MMLAIWTVFLWDPILLTIIFGITFTIYFYIEVPMDFFQDNPEGP